jgi:hypothetical protein
MSWQQNARGICDLAILAGSSGPPFLLIARTSRHLLSNGPRYRLPVQHPLRICRGFDPP